MKLSDYARKIGVSYRTAYRYWKAGQLTGKQLPTGTIIVEDDVIVKHLSIKRVAIYCRVSSSEDKRNLESQVERVTDVAAANGYQITHVVKEIGSGLNDNCKKLLNLLDDKDWDILIVEHKDRLARFGTKIIESLLQQTNRQLKVINEAQEGESDLMQDFVSIITFYCTRLYGFKHSKRKIERIIKELNQDE